jgi:hypothetical protein
MVRQSASVSASAEKTSGYGCEGMRVLCLASILHSQMAKTICCFVGGDNKLFAMGMSTSYTADLVGFVLFDG